MILLSIFIKQVISLDFLLFLSQKILNIGHFKRVLKHVKEI